MALRNITIPIAAVLFATALAYPPAMAAPAGSNAGHSTAGPTSGPSGGGRSGSNAARSGGGGRAAHSGGARSGGVRFHSGGGYVAHGTHYTGHRSRGRSHRVHRSGGFFFGFGAPYPYYYQDDGYIVCRYRRVRYHDHWVRRRYCWRQYW